MPSSLALGRVEAGLRDAQFVRPHSRLARNPLIYVHSAAASPAEAVAAAPLPSVRPILDRLSRWGFEAVAPTVVPMFGADLDPIETAIAHARSDMLATAAPPIIIGTSAGAPAAIRYAMGDGAESAAAIVLFIPAIDLVTLYTDDVGGLQDDIAGAWGVTPPAALPATADLLGRAAEATVPILQVVASDDVVSTNFAAFAAAASDVTTDNVGALGHFDAAIAAADVDQIVEFIQGAA